MKQVEDPVPAATNVDLDAIRPALHRGRVSLQCVFRSDLGDATVHEEGQIRPSRGHQAVALGPGLRRLRRDLIDVAQDGPRSVRTTSDNGHQRYGRSGDPASHAAQT